MNIHAEHSFSKATGEFVSLLSSFSPKEFNKEPFKGSWSPAQVGEHILLSYGVVKTLQGTTVASDRPADHKVEGIKKTFLDFSIKMSAPKAILPGGSYSDQEILIAELSERINVFYQVIRREDLSVICKDFIIPEYGPFTRMEWIYFSCFHTQRHSWQLKNIRDMFVGN